MESLEDLINEFIKDKKVIDIKYQANVSYAASDGMAGCQYFAGALIMYEEKQQDHINSEQCQMCKGVKPSPQLGIYYCPRSGRKL